MQQSDDDPHFDELLITLNRVSAAEYTAICGQLQALPGVKEFRENGEPAWSEVSGHQRKRGCAERISDAPLIREARRKKARDPFLCPLLHETMRALKTR